MILGGVLMVFPPVESYTCALVITVVISTCLGVYAMMGLYFAIMGEAKIPLAVIGTVIGLPSVVGYLPDVFMALLMGYFLDKYEALAICYQYILGLLICFAILGLIVTLIFKRVTNTRATTGQDPLVV